MLVEISLVVGGAAPDTVITPFSCSCVFVLFRGETAENFVESARSAAGRRYYGRLASFSFSIVLLG
jgi:hypothetical protein